MLFLHSFEELFCTHVPIDLVGFGDEEAGQGLFVVSQFLLECGVVHQSGYFGGVYHELFAYAACQPVQCACAADGEIRRFLISAVQTAEYVIYVFPRPDGVASGVYIFGIFLVLGHPAEAGEASRMALLFHLIIYGVGGVVAVYIDIDCLFRMELRGKQIVVYCSCTSCSNKNQCDECSDNDFLLFHFVLLHL